MSSEKFAEVPGENKDVAQGDILMTEAELKEAEEMYKVAGNSNTSKAAIGAMVLGAALAAMPDDANAQSRERTIDSTKIAQAETEKRIVSEGVASHPELGDLKIEILYKQINPKNPYGYGVLINGVEQKVDFAQFMRNGSGIVELKNQDGTKAIISFKVGTLPMFTAKEGDTPVPLK